MWKQINYKIPMSLVSGIRFIVKIKIIINNDPFKDINRLLKYVIKSCKYWNQ